MIPQTKYADSGAIKVAYQVFGSGSVDLVLVPGWISNIDTFWEEPCVVRFFHRLATFARVILFDKRGTGLSDRVTHTPTLEERMGDVRAVLDAVRSRRTVLLGYSEGGPMCALFAATYPERTEGLIMIGSYPRLKPADDYPWGRPPEEQEAFLRAIRDEWGGPVGIELRAPSLADDERFRRWWAKLLRTGASPTTALALTKANSEIDVRKLLGSITVPALLIHGTRDKTIPIGASRFMTEQIPGAKLVELDTQDHLPFIGCPDEILDSIEEFVTGQRVAPAGDRVVQTVMFTDIVGSTEMLSKLGDVRWRDALEAHHATIRTQLEIYDGREVNTTGDGFYATFDGPARAIRCACDILEAVASLGISLRIGLHTGECIIKAGGVEGLAVHIGARVAALAKANMILVSQTVRDLVAGSGIQFEDFGKQQLKGIADEWHLYTVKAA